MIILKAFLKGDLEVLQDWCHEAVSEAGWILDVQFLILNTDPPPPPPPLWLPQAFNLLAAVTKQRIEPGTQIVDCKVLDVSNVDVSNLVYLPGVILLLAPPIFL